MTKLKPYPAYQDSSVPWLGDIPPHWSTERAKWLFQRMKRPVRPDDDVVTCFRDGTVTLRRNRRVLGFTNALKEIGYQGVRRGDLVIHAMDAFAGAVGVSDSDGKCTPVYAVCQPQSDASPQYYAYVVREMARSQWIAALAKGVRERSTDFRFEGFAAQFVPVPPRNEQDRITAFLNHIDRRTRRYIRAQRKLITLLEEQKQTLIQRAVTRGLDPNVRLKPSGVEWLGDMPEHWQVVSLSVSTHSIQTGPFGSQLHASEYVTGGIPVINPSHMRDGRIHFDPAIAISEQKAKELERHALQAGDVVMARRGELGRCALVHEAEDGWLCGTGSLRIRPKNHVFVSEYLVLLLGSSGVRDMLSLSSIGATMDNLNAGMVGRLRLPCPPVQEQRQVMDHINSESSKIQAALLGAQRQIDLIREYRTRLIADAVTGKLDVRQAAANLPGELEEADEWEPGEAEEGDDEDLDETGVEADDEDD